MEKCLPDLAVVAEKSCHVTNVTAAHLQKFFDNPNGYLSGHPNTISDAPEALDNFVEAHKHCGGQDFLACGESFGKVVAMFGMNAPSSLLLTAEGKASLNTAPSQVRLSLGGSDPVTNAPTGMYAGWYTQDVADTQAQYGLSPTSLHETATGSSRQYLKSFGYHHFLFLNVTALRAGSKPAAAASAAASPSSPAQRVYYRVGSAGSGWSPVFSFSSVGLRREDRIRMAIFGDFGWEDSKQRPAVISGIGGLVKQWTAVPSRAALEQLLTSNSIDSVWHLGDISYADDAYVHTPVHFSYERVFNGFQNWLQNVSAAVPYMVSVGNHEVECHSPHCQFKTYGAPLKNFTAYNARFRMPAPESGGVQNMWYSYNFGPVHFVSLNTETDFPGAGEETRGDYPKYFSWPAGGFGRKGQYLAWLEADLKAADEARRSGSANGRPWIIAGGHRPSYSISDQVDALFEKYGVDAYFSGHVHSYCRSIPGSVTPSAALSAASGAESYDVYTDWNATMRVTTGGPGCDEMPLDTAKVPVTRHSAGDTSTKSCAGGKQSNHSSVATARYSMGVMDVNRTHLTWRLRDSADGSLLDGFVLQKKL